MFKNMKIEIKDESHLKAVCDVLESMGYKNDQFDFPIQNHRDIKQFQSVACYQQGKYSVYKLSVDQINFCELITLTDLLKMRDITDNVSDIRNHLSPHTVVIDL